MDAGAAAAALGVSRSTLYAYVSRGLVRAAADPRSRRSRYRRSEIERLALDRRRTRSPALVARASLDWGRPVLNSALTLVENGRLYYRGHDVVELAQAASLEDVAALLWDTSLQAIADTPRPTLGAAALRPLAGLAAASRCTAGFAWLAALDAAGAARPGTPPAVQAQPEGAPTIARCARLLQLMTLATCGRAATRKPAHRQLARAWRLDDAAADRLRQALVLCADHEFNASSFAARCIASTGADAAAGVVAGLAALSGPRHGGVTAEVERLWDASTAPGSGPRAVARLVGAMLQTAQERAPGQGVAGFGHPFYPDGDPRARAILAAMPRAARNERLSAAVRERSGAYPSLDFALVALRRSLGLPPGHGYLVFALGRTVGWLAHVLEQSRDATLIRPRAAYVGARPAAATAPPGLVSRVIRRR